MLMNRRLVQIERGRWPGGQGRTIAILRIGTAEIAQLYGLKFEPGVDDLDDYEEAAVRLPTGRVVVLVRYRGDAEAGVSVEIDKFDIPEEARREFVDVLEVDESIFLWIGDAFT